MHVRQKGVMTLAVYDPDKDGLIALAQLVAAVCSETEADGKITTHKGDASAHHAKYTNTEAVTAMGTKVKTNPLHHDYPPEDPAAATKGLRSLGSGALQAAAGNHAHTLVEDVTGDAPTSWNPTVVKAVFAGQDKDIDGATKTLAFAAGSRAVGVGGIAGESSAANAIKLRLYMGGVQVAESAFYSTSPLAYWLVATRALSGSQITYIALHNYHGSDQNLTVAPVGGDCGGGVGVGSVKT